MNQTTSHTEVPPAPAKASQTLDLGALQVGLGVIVAIVTIFVFFRNMIKNWLAPIEKDVEDLKQKQERDSMRLTRFETLTETIKEGQKRIEDKLDRFLEMVATGKK